jgi:D-xylose transport system permease protein
MADTQADTAEPGTPATIETPIDPRTLFQVDVTPRTPQRALREYYARLRSGDPGALPAVLGLLILMLIFSQVSSRFLTKSNLGNLPGQASFIAVIALGLVFVLLLGEIDLSAGTTGGMCAAFAAQAIHSGDLQSAVGSFLYWTLVALMALALVLAVLNRLILAPIMITAGLVITLTGLDKHVVPATIFGLGIGFAVGVLIGTMVAKIGIPSFVVTLALFLTWQGVILFALKSQPLDVTRYNFWYGLAQNTMTPFWGWVYYIVVVGGYLVVTLVRATRRHAAGLSADTLALVLLRAGAIALGGLIVLLFLNQNRNPNIGKPIEGVPWALSIPLTLMIGAAIVLTKTTWGRHLYATGGNAEAARRAGIKVDQIRMSAFALCSGFAALGGFFLSSYTGGVQLDLGGGNTLLFAVAAAVIGGTSLFGGRGKPRDAIIGAFVIATIPNGIGLKPSLDVRYTIVITGLVLLIAATVDALSRKRATAS